MSKNLFFVPLLTLLLSGCGAHLADPTAYAELLDAQGKQAGTVKLMPEVGGNRMLVTVSGLKPGKHGMHIHEHPRCEPGPDAEGKTIPFGAAGGHFSPEQSGNHASPTAPNRNAHAGDLPMIEVGADGTGQASFQTQKVRLSGNESVFGRSIVIHADPDDYATDPAGNSGGRVLCGVFHR